MKLMIFATTAIGHFYRLGRRFEKVGTFCDVSDFSEDEQRILQAEPNLNIREATEEEIAKHETPFGEVSNDILIDALVATIPDLPDEAFTKDGMPSLKDLRKLSDLGDDLITAELRDAAMKKLVKGGFKSPVKT